MDVIRIAGLAIIVAVLAAFLRREVHAVGMMAAAGFVLITLAFLLAPLRQVVDLFSELAYQANVRSVYLALVLKAIGIAYVTAIGTELCRDAGEGGIGTAVELAGKVFILLLAVPVVAAILEVLVRILPG